MAPLVTGLLCRPLLVTRYFQSLCHTIYPIRKLRCVRMQAIKLLGYLAKKYVLPQGFVPGAGVRDLPTPSASACPYHGRCRHRRVSCARRTSKITRFLRSNRCRRLLQRPVYIPRRADFLPYGHICGHCLLFFTMPCQF